MFCLVITWFSYILYNPSPRSIPEPVDHDDRYCHSPCCCLTWFSYVLLVHSPRDHEGENNFAFLAVVGMGFPLWPFLAEGAPRKRDSKGGNQGGGVAALPLLLGFSLTILLLVSFSQAL